MIFKLPYSYNEPIVENFEMLEDEILMLEDESGEAVILKPEEAINKCNYIQTYFWEEREKYVVEISIQDSTGIRNIRMYRYETIDVREVLALFKAYYEKGEAPDYTTWKDVTYEVLQED